MKKPCMFPTAFLVVALATLLAGALPATGQAHPVSLATSGLANSLQQAPSRRGKLRIVARSVDLRGKSMDPRKGGEVGSGSNEPLAVSGAYTTTRVSIASDGTQSDGRSCRPCISADGRYVGFQSEAENLVISDTNGNWDIFVHDRQTGETTRVSVSSHGTEGNATAWHCSLSGDGRHVGFDSQATNLVTSDTNRCADVFVHDRQTGQTTRVSVSSDGTQSNDQSWLPTLSACGRYVAFESFADNLVISDTNDSPDVFVYDRQTGETTLVSVSSDGTPGNSSSLRPAISADGRYIAFASEASNLVPGDTNDAYDAFVHDRQTGQTTRVSVASDGTEGNDGSGYLAATDYDLSISADGRYVAFFSWATNLVAGDTNGKGDIFVHDRQTRRTARVSVSSRGTQSDDHSGLFAGASISADGRYVVFDSYATDLVSGDTNGDNDVFVHDRILGRTTRVSVASVGTEGNRLSMHPWISGDGRFVAFYSLAHTLVGGDTNETSDVFVHDRGWGSPYVFCLPLVLRSMGEGQCWEARWNVQQ